MDDSKARAVADGGLWDAESLLVGRLAYPPAADRPGVVHDRTPPVPSPSYLGSEPEVTAGEVDR